MKNKGFLNAIMKVLSKKFSELLETYETLEPIVDEVLELAGAKDVSIILRAEGSEILIYKVSEDITDNRVPVHRIDLAKIIERKK